MNKLQKKLNSKTFGLLLTFLLILTTLIQKISYGSENPDSFKQSLMTSGLRRSIALDAPLGDLLMRNMSYRFFSLSERNDKQPSNEDSIDLTSNIGQFNSLLELGKNESHNFLLQTTARHVDFEIGSFFKASNKRLDIGLLGSTNDDLSASYFSANIIAESSVGRPETMPMSRSGNGIGIRLEGGKQVSNKWSLSGKAEFLDWHGTQVMQPKAAGDQNKKYDISNNRIYANIDLIRNFSLLGGQSSWRTGFHYLTNNYDNRLNRDLSSYIEPFGDNEAISVARTSFLQTWSIPTASKFKFFIEIDLDFEVENSMHKLNSDRFGLNQKIGMSWNSNMNSMLRLEYHNFEGRQGLGNREGIMLVFLLDGI